MLSIRLGARVNKTGRACSSGSYLLGDSGEQNTQRATEQLTGCEWIAIPSLQTIQGYMVSYHWALHKHYWVCTMSRRIPQTISLEILRRWGNKPLNGMLVQLFGTIAKAVTSLTIKHVLADTSHWATLKLGKKNIVDYLIGMVFYQIYHGWRHNDRTIWKGALSTMEYASQAYSIHISLGVKALDGSLCDSWAVPADIAWLQ